MMDFIDDIIRLHHMVCNINDNKLSYLVINRWADIFKKNSACQIFMQSFSVMHIYLSSPFMTQDMTTAMAATLSCMMSSLNDTITHRHRRTPGTKADGMQPLVHQFQDVYVIMNHTLSVLKGTTDLGVFLDEIPDNLPDMLQMLIHWISHDLLVLFWEEGGFVDYDPWNPVWYPGRAARTYWCLNKMSNDRITKPT